MADITELTKKLKADLPSELNGAKEYANLSRMAHENGDHCWAAMLKDMAWEEHTHAKHIMHILDKQGVSYSELVPAYNDVTAMLHNL